ncbi:hypothetical protein GCM10023322_27040 [Rugosimonospora acidiphila]|uniref:OmpR/PhoB-type domain-containing protein n=1 Tax=Rugosimonospora acidiphila TaxID=556531 RepID=A0ABP9RS97_9ACTN
MQVGMLGPLEVRTGTGELVPVAGARLRALLILLALQPAATLSTDRLVEALWDERPPAGAGNALQALVSRLRRAVPGIAVLPRHSGYLLDLDPDRVDTVRFERLASAGRARLREDPAGAAATLRDALALWRGPALADVARADFARGTIVRLDELRLAAIQDRVDADLRLGAGASLIPELEELVATHPLREPLVALFIRALDAAGRRAEALELYERTRRRIAERLGAEPSAELASLHLAMLRSGHDAAPAPATQPTATATQPSAALPTTAPPTPLFRAAPHRATTDQAAADRPTAGGTAPDRAAPIQAAPIQAAPIQAAPIQAAPIQTAASRAGGSAPSAPLPGSGAGSGTGSADEPARSNLRAERTSLIGREEDLAQVGELLAAHRMITLTGPGGAGKTRLVEAAARAALHAQPDGAWLVELAPITDPAHVAAAVLDALGLRQTALATGGSLLMTGDPAGRLVGALSDKRALLVLDNCEHLIDAAAALADRILSACPDVTILATSREPLCIGGEALWPVRPLALPPEAADPVEPALIANCASVRLLTQRARAVRPDFEVNAGNAGAVAHICRALDGMPLAIELAAARLRSMSPEQLAARLDDRFTLLTGGSRTALARHQTLAAVVGWSWDLLDDAERALWRRLSVFAGGATLEAAERVCAGGLIGRDRVLDLLAALVDKSLLVMREDAGAARYHMLEIIKAYGQQRLDEAGERVALRRAHGRYFVRLAETAQYELVGARQLEWLDRLSADHDNLHAAVRNAVGAGDTMLAARLVAALGFYWWAHGHKVEGTELVSAALSLPVPAKEAGDGVPDDARVVAYAMGGLLAVDSRHSPDLAVPWFQTAARLAARVPEPRHPMVRLVTLITFVFEASMAVDKPVSLASLEEAMDDPFPWMAATARLIRAHVGLNFGRSPVGARADFQLALDRYRELGERWGTAFSLASLASLELWRGEFATAAANYREALRACQELGGRDDEAQFRAQLARTLWLLGERDQAHDQLAQARRLAQRLGLPEPRGQTAYISGDLARLEGNLVLARSELTGADELAAQYAVASQFHAILSASLAQVAIAAGDLDTARSHYTHAAEAALVSVDAPVIGQVLVAGADLALHAGDPAAAAALLGASTAVRGSPDLSNLDEPRVAAAARAALGAAAFDEAYRRGGAANLMTWSELPGARPAGDPDSLGPDA